MKRDITTPPTSSTLCPRAFPELWLRGPTVQALDHTGFAPAVYGPNICCLHVPARLGCEAKEKRRRRSERKHPCQAYNMQDRLANTALVSSPPPASGRAFGPPTSMCRRLLNMRKPKRRAGYLALRQAVPAAGDLPALVRVWVLVAADPRQSCRTVRPCCRRARLKDALPLGLYVLAAARTYPQQ